MGHLRLGNLPRTRRWQQVVQLIDAGAATAQTANATITAAEQGFKEAGTSPSVAEAFWRLLQLPLAARSDDFSEALRQSGIEVGTAPTLFDITASLADAGTKRDANDLGEMARLASIEALQHVAGNRLAGLFDSDASDLQRELKGMAGVRAFGILARRFFACLTQRYLNYFLSRTLLHHVGEGRRFATLAQTGEFVAAIRTHCFEAALIVESYAGEWLSKTNWENKGVDKDMTAKFVRHALQKVLGELKRGAAASGT